MPRIRGKVRPYKGDKTGREWQLDYHDYRGIRHQPKFPGTKKQAEIQLDRIIRKQWALKEQIVEPIYEVTIEKAIRRYIKYQQNRGRANGTIKRFQDSIRGLCTVIGAQEKIHAVTVQHLDALENRRLGAVKVETFKTELRHLRAFFNWAKRYDHIRKNPFAQYVFDLRSRPDKEKNVLTIGEIIRLLIESLKIGFEAFQVIAFFLSTGMRLGEIASENFKWDWVAFKRQKFRHVDVKSRHPKIIITRKMSPITHEILRIRERISSTAPFKYRPDYYANHYIEPAFKNAGLFGMSAKHLRSTAAGHVYLR